MDFVACRKGRHLRYFRGDEFHVLARLHNLREKSNTLQISSIVNYLFLDRTDFQT